MVYFSQSTKNQAAVPPLTKCSFREEISRKEEKIKDIEEASQREDAENGIILKSKDNILPPVCTNLS